jgi:hypothetical protein
MTTKVIMCGITQGRSVTKLPKQIAFGHIKLEASRTHNMFYQLSAQYTYLKVTALSPFSDNCWSV